jgi:hypothetical protein
MVLLRTWIPGITFLDYTKLTGCYVIVTSSVKILFMGHGSVTSITLGEKMPLL